MREHHRSRRVAALGVALLALSAAAAVAAIAVAAVAAPAPRATHKRPRHPRYLGVHVTVLTRVVGRRSRVVVRFRERQRILYTVRVERTRDLLNSSCDLEEQAQAHGRPGHVATFRIRPSFGERWCTGRWSVRVLHVTYGPDPCTADEICRESPPEYDRLLGGGHFRVR